MSKPTPNELRAHLDGLDPALFDHLVGRDMLLTQDWSRPEIDSLCALTEVFEAFDRAGVTTPLFPHQLFYALFFDNSTRTKSSWAGAAARLGAQPVIVDGSSTQVSHGETAEETGAMLGMNSHALGIRHDLILGQGNRFMRDASKGLGDYLEATDDRRSVPIINLQCDIDHPTQTLADLCWLRELFAGDLAGKTVAVSWAHSPSYAKPLSVPQGLITLLPRFGVNVRLAHPPGYELLPECLEHAERNAREAGSRFEICASMDEVFAGADVVYPKSWGPQELMLERVEANRQDDQVALRRIENTALDRNQHHSDWICDARRMALTRDGAAHYMHCLPADIGDEVSREVMDRFRLEVSRQANKKVYVIMALLAATKQRALLDRLVALVSD